MDKTCMFCGDTFQTSDTRQLYCSVRCRTAAYIARRKERKEAARRKVCQVCGKPFQAKNVRAEYCSTACKLKAYRQRKRAEASGNDTETG